MTRLFSFKTADIKALSESLKEKYCVFFPQQSGKNYLQWAQGKFSPDYYGNTLMPLKNHFLPQSEKLFAFKGRKGKARISEEAECVKESVFFGVRMCDIKSIELLDKVFLSEGFIDRKYKEKRDKTFLVGFHCLEPYETCFCTSMQYDLLDNPACDIFFIKIGDDEYLACVSQRAEQLLSQSSLKKIEASPEQLERLDKTTKEFKNKFKIKFEIGEDNRELKDFFADSYFEEISFKCLGCGICAFVCPTCHCFAIEDIAEGRDGYRLRCRDHCQNPDFTLMAGGHNPRTTKASRIRQRLLHKGVYFKDRYGALGCVGCGRCLIKCPVSMDICEGLLHVRGGELK